MHCTITSITHLFKQVLEGRTYTHTKHPKSKPTAVSYSVFSVFLLTIPYQYGTMVRLIELHEKQATG
jgi:hypothetical protein